MHAVSGKALDASAKVEKLCNVPPQVICAYATFGVVGFTVFHLVAEREPSSTLTLSALAQCLGISLLWIQIQSGKSAAGISAKALILDALAICFRLSSTLFLDGYLPNSRDGDYMYQAFDVCSVLMLLFLLRLVFKTHANTYQASEDTFPIGPTLLGCFFFAALLHGDMDDNPIFDTFWMTGLFTSVVAVLPQFWLLMQAGGKAGPLTSHYIGAMALSRFLSGCFAFMAWEHLTCEAYIGSFQHSRYAILGVHILHSLILCDFAWKYVRSMAKQGICGTVSFQRDAYDV